MHLQELSHLIHTERGDRRVGHVESAAIGLIERYVDEQLVELVGERGAGLQAALEEAVLVAHR